MKRIIIACIAIALASGAVFAQADSGTTAAPAPTAAVIAPAPAPAAAPAAASPAATASAAPITVTASIVRIVPADRAKSAPAKIVVKLADGKQLTLAIDKASTFKKADGKAAKIAGLLAGSKATVVYTAGEKENILVSLTLAK